jgi:hypothetical protein
LGGFRERHHGHAISFPQLREGVLYRDPHLYQLGLHESAKFEQKNDIERCLFVGTIAQRHRVAIVLDREILEVKPVNDSALANHLRIDLNKRNARIEIRGDLGDFGEFGDLGLCADRDHRQ